MGANWAELPRELLSLILKRFPPLTGILVCRSWYSSQEATTPLPPWVRLPNPSKPVCRSWYSSEEATIPLPPWLPLPNPSKPKRGFYCLFNLANEKAYYIKEEKKQLIRPPFYDKEEESVQLLVDCDDIQCVGSSHGWLAYVNNGSVIYLVNPFLQTSPIIQLPLIGRYQNGPWPKRQRCTYHGNASSRSSRIFIRKLVLSGAPWHRIPRKTKSYTVMIIYGQNYAIANKDYNIAFCKSGDTVWTPLNGPLSPYCDIIYSDNDQQFYALSSRGVVEAWDLTDSFSPKRTLINIPFHIPIKHESRAKNYTYNKYLVESSGDLLLVFREILHGGIYAQGHKIYLEDVVDEEILSDDDDDPYYKNFYKDPYKTRTFEIRKLDRVEQKWIPINSLGDNVLFLGMNHAVSLPAREFPELSRNSIYFTDDHFDLLMYYKRKRRPYLGHDYGIFNLGYYTIHPCFPPEYSVNIQPPSIWVLPNP